MFAITLGPSQIVILLLVGILLFGNRVPNLGRVLAKTIREFQNAWHGIEDQVSEALTGPAPDPRVPRLSVGLPRLDTPGDNNHTA
jgi:sec-independent protein translocase protein TatA